jgi:hypothetical protein
LVTTSWIDIVISWLAKAPELPALRQPSPHGTLAYCPASAAAREQHDERYTGAQPDRSLDCKIHLLPPFVVLVAFFGYRPLLRDRRRFKKRIMIPPAAIQMLACIIVSLIVCTLLCLLPKLSHHGEQVLEDL